MYKLAVLTYAIAGGYDSISLFFEKAPNMIWVILAGMVVTFLIIAFLLALSVSVNVHSRFVVISSDKLSKVRACAQKSSILAIRRFTR